MVESGIGRLLYVDKKSLYLTPFEESVKGSCFYIEQSSEFSETEKEQLIKLRSKVLAVSSGDMRVLNRRIQIIEQLCGLLGCLGVGLWSFGISVWLLVVDLGVSLSWASSVFAIAFVLSLIAIALDAQFPTQPTFLLPYSKVAFDHGHA